MGEIEIIKPESRYIVRYFDKDGKRGLKVIFATDIYQARSKAIEMIGGIDKLINCHRLYNPTYDNNIYYD